jgi:uncharacterized protein DUF3565
MRRTITGFYEDIEGHFVAMLDCGHEQHVRHRPPFSERPWVLTEEGRRAKIGEAIDCRSCDESLDPGNQPPAANRHEK